MRARVAILICVVFWSVSVCAPAEDPRSFLQPPYTLREFEHLIASIPGITADQQMILTVLYADMVAQFDRIADELHDERRTAEERITQIYEIRQHAHPLIALRESGMQEVLDESIRKKSEVESKFDESVGAVFDEEQRAAWQSLQRAVERRRLLPTLARHIPNRRVPDLRLACVEMGVADELKIKPILDDYEEVMGSFLDQWEMRRGKVFASRQAIAARGGGMELLDPAIINDLEKPLDALADGIRSVSVRYEKVLANTLGESRSSEFLDYVWGLEVPELFVVGPLDLLAPRIAELPLEVAQRPEIAQTLESAMEQLRRTRARLMNVLRSERTARAIREQASIEQERQGRVNGVKSSPEDRFNATLVPLLAEIRRIHARTCCAIRERIPIEDQRRVPADLALILRCDWWAVSPNPSDMD